VTASRSTKAALPICDTCGASGGNRRAVRLMPSTKKRELLRGEDFDEAIDSIVGIVITHLSG
jgi:hypothetical protein